jgi:hypothetical protein
VASIVMAHRRRACTSVLLGGLRGAVTLVHQIREFHPVIDGAITWSRTRGVVAAGLDQVRPRGSAWGSRGLHAGNPPGSTQGTRGALPRGAAGLRPGELHRLHPARRRALPRGAAGLYPGERRGSGRGSCTGCTQRAAGLYPGEPPGSPQGSCRALPRGAAGLRPGARPRPTRATPAYEAASLFSRYRPADRYRPAEREGFEPSEPVTRLNSLAVSPIRPLSHLSGLKASEVPGGRESCLAL